MAHDRKAELMHVSETSSKGFSATSPKMGFCPFGGLMGDSADQFDQHLQPVLKRRLRTASLILFGAFAAFLVRNLLAPHIPESATLDVFIPHVLATVVMGGLFLLLRSERQFCVSNLRVIELFVFGLPAVFSTWMQFRIACNCAPGAVESAQTSLLFSTISWLILMQLYGVFVPNPWKRAAIVIVLMAALPIIGALGAASQNEAVRAALGHGVFSSMVLWLGIGAVTSIYGSHRFGAQRRETFDLQQVGVYSLREKLGSGGMGDVYLAEHRLLKRPCAIKLIKPEIAGDEKAIARFESEVQVAARLTHPNTIEIYDYGHTQDGTFYYAMEYLPGLNLQEMVDRFGPLPPHRLVHLLVQVCSALREAHAAGVIHRDIKPSNIFVTERGGLYDIAKLLDFGLVKSVAPGLGSPNVTLDGAVVGSPQYAAPESTLDDSPDVRSDIYSLGATAYFLLTAQAVFPGENALKVIFAHANQQPAPPSEVNADVPADLEAVVLRCLAKDPDDRYSTIEDVEGALSACSCRDCWTQDDAQKWWSDSEETGGRTPTVHADAFTETIVVEGVR